MSVKKRRDRDGGAFGLTGCWNKKRGVKKKYLTPPFFCCMIAQVMKVDKILEQSLLFDFYGELLTEHQKEIYERFIAEDLSLGEIAEEAGISRQGVHDLIKRCNQTLRGYEEKLHLLEKFLAVKDKVERIEQLLDQYNEEGAEELVRNIRKISGEIIEEL